MFFSEFGRCPEFKAADQSHLSLRLEILNMFNFFAKNNADY